MSIAELDVMSDLELSGAAPEMDDKTAAPMQVLQLLFGRHIAHAVSAVARLGVADYVHSEPRGVDELARLIGAHRPSLYRVMRLLSAVGMFREHEGQRFSSTAMSETLRTDQPGTLRHFATMQGDFWTIRAMEKLPYTIQTGVDGITAAFGRHVFELMGDHPKEAETFQKAMTSFSSQAGQAVVAAYDFSEVRCLADVGGGYGTLLSTILQANPHMRGVLFDLAEVTAAPGTAEELGPVAERVRTESGSFFERVPAGCDAYVLKHILHDWDDERCRVLLKFIQAQLPAEGRVLLCEMVVPDGPDMHVSKLMDMEMLAHCVGGRERTKKEFADLLQSAGLELTRVIPTMGPFCLIEARPIAK